MVLVLVVVVVSMVVAVFSLGGGNDDIGSNIGHEFGISVAMFPLVETEIFSLRKPYKLLA